MSWVKDFYSETGRWWGRAESQVTDEDRDRVDSLRRLTGRSRGTVLDIGSGYGNTAAAFAGAGYDVTGIEISDRIQFASQHLDELRDRPDAGRLDFVQADFNEFDRGHRFDVVTYWNGFGIGSDDDQRRLLTRVRSEWLTSEGWLLMDVFNPVRWIAWAGDRTHRNAAPELGYPFSVSEVTDYDPIQSRFIDTWTREGQNREWSQSQRCYSPADLALLLEPTGLQVVAMEVGGESFDPSETADRAHPLWSSHEYRVALRTIA